MDLVRRRLPDCTGCTGLSVERRAELFVPEEERSTWSPWLSVRAVASGGGTELVGRFAPHPNVWTVYRICAGILAAVALVGGGLGWAQWSIGRPPWGLVALPVSAALGFALYLASLVGQRLSAHQMDQLRDCLEELLSDVERRPG